MSNNEYGQNLKGKVALITGSSRGIGAGCAIRLAEHGADVVINYVSSAQAAQDVATKCRSLGVRALVFKADVTKSKEVEAMFDACMKEFGRVDIVFSNSGVEHWGKPDEVTEQQMDEVFAINIKAQYFVSQQAYKHMSDYGRLMLISSISAQRGVPAHAIYASTKAAVQAMARCLAMDFGPRNITVNTVAPGGIKTDMYTHAAAKYIPGGDKLTEEEIDAQIGKWSPLGRPGYVDDVAGTVALLASSEAQWLTGQVLHVNGGAHMSA